MTTDQLMKVAFGGVVGYMLGKNPALAALVGAYVGYKLSQRPMHIPMSTMLPEVELDDRLLADLGRRAQMPPPPSEVIEMQAMDDDQDYSPPSVWSAEY